MTKALAFVLSMAITFSFAAQTDADMYKWVDRNGVIHYSDTPPSTGQQVDTLKTPDYAATESDAEPVDPQHYPQPVDAQDTSKIIYNEVFNGSRC